MPQLDLTPFGFTPTESAVYQVLLADGPGTGYAIARSAGLARANAYSALEGLVAKGAARVETGRPRRYRPEPPAALIARISTDHGHALDRLSKELESIVRPRHPDPGRGGIGASGASAHHSRYRPRRRIGRAARAGRRLSAPGARRFGARSPRA